MKIPIFQITVNAGRREADQEAVQELANSISKVGLLNPITVDQDYTLIAGLHRLEAAKLLGWSDIECNVSSLEGLLVDLAEIDENIVRKGISGLEYNDLLLRRKEIYESIYPETKRGMRNGQTSKTRNLRVLEPKSFSQDAAEKTGVSRSTVERQIQAAKNMTPEAKEILRRSGTKITKQSALKLSRLPPDEQNAAANQLATGTIKSMNEYHPALAKPEDAEEPEQAPEVPSAAEPAPPPKAPVPPPPEVGYYPTIRDSVADLKNPDKERGPTPDTFLASLSAFLNRFCQTAKTYADEEYTTVFPALTQEHLEQIHREIDSARDVLSNLYHQIEGNVKHEQT